MDSNGAGEDAMIVTLQGNICTIQTVTSRVITCKTSAGTHGDNLLSVTVTYNGST